jgi:NADH-quinone oxidoreductase subunit A
MVKAYLPVLFFLAFGVLVGVLFRTIGFVFTKRFPTPAKLQPYECGLPSDVRKSFRFGISFYLMAMLFLLFDVEILFLYPIAIQLGEFGTFAMVETIVFIGLLAVGYVFVWARGALEWR